jgi:hypothetical protein
VIYSTVYSSTNKKTYSITTTLKNMGCKRNELNFGRVETYHVAHIADQILSRGEQTLHIASCLNTSDNKIQNKPDRDIQKGKMTARPYPQLLPLEQTSSQDMVSFSPFSYFY